MTTALEAIRGELATLRQRIGRLEQAEHLLTPTYELPPDPELIAPFAARAPISRPRRSGHRNPTRAQIREYIITHGPGTRGEIAAALGGNPDLVGKHLLRLLRKGEIGAEGSRGSRTYQALAVTPHTPGSMGPRVATPIGTRTSKTPPDRGVYPVYDAIVDLDGATTEQIASRTSLPRDRVVEQGRRLVQLGLVRFTGVGNARVWIQTQSETISDAA